MFRQEIYVAEKLRELEQTGQRHGPFREPPRKPRPVIGPIARKAGRALRRFGEGLESWGGPQAPEQPRSAQYQ